QHWMNESIVRSKRINKSQGDWFLAFCDVTSATNERTSISAILPLCGFTRSMPAIYLESQSPVDAALLDALMSSYVVDYLVRLKVAGNHLTQGILDSVPVPHMQTMR